MNKILTILTILLITSCSKDNLCNSNEILKVYSKQGTHLVLLDVLYDEDRDCSITKETQELNNNCNRVDRYCEWQ